MIDGSTLTTMSKHQDEVHPTYVEGCFVCKASSVSVAASATPTRRGGADAARVNATEKEWARDMASYRALRANGLQPPAIDGSHRLEGATDKLEVEAGHVFKSKEALSEVREQMNVAGEYAADQRIAARDASA